jgi:hypothetical protein
MGRTIAQTSQTNRNPEGIAVAPLPPLLILCFWIINHKNEMRLGMILLAFHFCVSPGLDTSTRAAATTKTLFWCTLARALSRYRTSVPSYIPCLVRPANCLRYLKVLINCIAPRWESARHRDAQALRRLSIHPLGPGRPLLFILLAAEKHFLPF